jgi:hypothetical protein
MVGGMVVLPVTPSGAQFSFVAELDGVSYTLEWRWNWRDAGWYLTLGDGEGNPMAQNLRVVLNTALNATGFGRQEWPPGILFALDTSGKDVDATLDDLGSRVKVYYAEAADL